MVNLAALQTKLFQNIYNFKPKHTKNKKAELNHLLIPK